MLIIPNCILRDCINYIDIIGSEGDNSQVHSCKAFPKGIPDKIAYGDNKHLKPLKDQKNEIVYEKFKE